jgi:hypothetical protein
MNNGLIDESGSALTANMIVTDNSIVDEKACLSSQGLSDQNISPVLSSGKRPLNSLLREVSLGILNSNELFM